MDTGPLKTFVYVHSPLIEYAISESYYTSYAIHLKSNNPCFNRPASHVRRRYSEFVSLRQLLASHHPTIKSPQLPPKNYFQRFNDSFIEQRMKGLQTFLDEVLAIPVYLSDKSLHLFLQSTSSMTEINEQCLGDIPVPELISSEELTYSESRSSRSSLSSIYQHSQRFLQPLLTDEDNSRKASAEPSLITALNNNRQKSILVPKRNGSLDSSTGSSPSSSTSSSLEISYSSSLERAKQRRVSFSDTVKVAVVTNYGISILRP